MKKIVFTGPESTGKTTLCTAVASHFQITYVKETARDYLIQLDRKYNYDDLLQIAKLQIEEEDRITALNQKYLFCDTDLLTIKIWSYDKFKKCDEWILNELNNSSAEIYFLCVPEIPWQFDAQREDETRLNELLEIYKNELKFYNKLYIELRGNVNDRVETVIQLLTKLSIDFD